MKKIILKSILIVLMYTLQSCDSFVDVDLPVSQLTGIVVFENNITANAALIDVYSKLRDGGMMTGSIGGSSLVLGAYADELTYFGNDVVNIGLVYQNNLLPTTTYPLTYWRTSYHQIYCTNAIIEGCEASVALTESDKNVLIGEALFLRALLHFNLSNLFHDIPYITTTSYETNRLISRMPLATVRQNVIEDLTRAANLLPEAYSDPEKFRPNRAAVKALLARVYLYNGQWAEAANSASEVINNNLYTWETDLNKIFLKASTTTIWQLSPKLPGNNAEEGIAFFFNAGPPPNVALSNDLVNSFEENDLRKTNWILAISNASGTWHRAYKYKQNQNTGTSVEYSVVLRLAEQYLIRAEARARQGELVSAIEDLNRIRNLAGLPDTAATNQEQLIEAIGKERKHEFFAEYGHRFYDLKRTNRLDAVLSPVKPNWNSTDQHWPIPELETLANPNLTQNAGY